MANYTNLNIGMLRGIYALIESRNGLIEVGLAAGTDAALSADRRLFVNSNHKCRNAEDTQSMLSSILYSMKRINGDNVHSDKIHTLLTSSIIAIHMFNWINIEDGDVDCSDDALEIDAPPKFDNEVSFSDITAAATVIISTKLSFYNTNHHVGVGTMNSFVKKTLIAMIQLNDNELAEAYPIVHMIGHWASTHHVLKDLGISNVLDKPRFHPYTVSRMNITRDISLRISSFPAGTGKLAFCVAACKRLLSSRIAPYVRFVQNLGEIADAAIEVKRGGVRYHVGSAFLSGTKRVDTYDDLMLRFLGRLITFIKVVYPKSTLAKSSVCKDIASVHDDYDDAFEILCRSYSESMRTPAQSIIDRLNVDVDVEGELDVSELKAKFNNIA